jgi:hypothetical protein
MPFPLRGAPSGQPWETASGRQSELPSAPATPPRGAVYEQAWARPWARCGPYRRRQCSGDQRREQRRIRRRDCRRLRQKGIASIHVCMYLSILHLFLFYLYLCVRACACVYVCISDISYRLSHGQPFLGQQRQRHVETEPGRAGPGRARPSRAPVHMRQWASPAPSAGEPSPGKDVAADHARRAE